MVVLPEAKKLPFTWSIPVVTDLDGTRAIDGLLTNSHANAGLATAR
jgi:hypothetical protein